MVVYILLIVVLMIRPYGMFGRKRSFESRGRRHGSRGTQFDLPAGDATDPVQARWFWLIVLVAGLLYLPAVLENREIFGISLTNTQLLGIGLSQVNFTLIAIIAAIALNLLVGYTGPAVAGQRRLLRRRRRSSAAVLGVQHQLPFPLDPGLLGGLGRRWSASSSACRACGCAGSTCCWPPWRCTSSPLYVFLQYQMANFGFVGIAFESPSLFGDFALDTDERWYYFLARARRRSPSSARSTCSEAGEGRALVAMRDHDVAAASLGVNVADGQAQGRSR